MPDANGNLDATLEPPRTDLAASNTEAKVGNQPTTTSSRARGASNPRLATPAATSQINGSARSPRRMLNIRSLLQ